MLTVKASAATDGKRHNHAVSALQSLHIASDILDYPHELVAKHEILRLRKKAVVDVKIRAADGRGCHAQDHVFGMFENGIRHVIDFDVPWPVKYKCLHARFSRLAPRERAYDNPERAVGGLK